MSSGPVIFKRRQTFLWLLSAKLTVKQCRRSNSATSKRETMCFLMRGGLMQSRMPTKYNPEAAVDL